MAHVLSFQVSSPLTFILYRHDFNMSSDFVIIFPDKKITSFEKVNSTPQKVGVEITFANQIKVCAGI